MTKPTLHHRSFKVLGYKLPGIYFMPQKPKMGFVLWLFGSMSHKEKHQEALKKLAAELNLPVFCVDLSGHGEAPFVFEKTTPAQHVLEVTSVYDELCAEFGCGGGIVIGNSYGSFLLLQLLKSRQIVAGVLRAPALFKDSDLYTRWENLEQGDLAKIRTDFTKAAEQFAALNAIVNTAPLLVVEHELDDLIPPILPQTLAKKLSKTDYWLAKNFNHSTSSVSETEWNAYQDHLISWLNRL